jgi:hypothetical protein
MKLMHNNQIPYIAFAGMKTDEINLIIQTIPNRGTSHIRGILPEQPPSEAPGNTEEIQASSAISP